MAPVNACLAIAITLAVATLATVHAGDADITTDFVVPPNATLDANLFTFLGLKNNLFGAPRNASFKVTKASQVEFPILTGQSVSLASLQFAGGAINPPHTHPRCSELLLVLQGLLQVGFVDTTGKLFNQTLLTGEAFLFPKGLVHFQLNPDVHFPAFAVSAFGSSNAGTVSIPKAVFASGIDTTVLEKSFKTDAHTVGELVSAANMG